MSEQTYKEQLEELKQQQGGLTREEVAEMMQKRSEFTLDLNNLSPQVHRWVDRGAVMSCEHAAHPTHRAFKRRTNIHHQ